MLFAFHLIDAPGTGAQRAAAHAAHRAYLAEVADRIAFAGPLLDADGGPAGSLLVVDFADRGAALAWIEAEPFTRAGVYGRRELHAVESRWPRGARVPEPAPRVS